MIALYIPLRTDETVAASVDRTLLNPSSPLPNNKALGWVPLLAVTGAFFFGSFTYLYEFPYIYVVGGKILFHFSCNSCLF